MPKWWNFAKSGHTAGKQANEQTRSLTNDVRKSLTEISFSIRLPFSLQFIAKTLLTNVRTFNLYFRLRPLTSVDKSSTNTIGRYPPSRGPKCSINFLGLIWLSGLYNSDVGRNCCRYWVWTLTTLAIKVPLNFFH